MRERGVTHAALFGSRARGDARPDSDIDIMIDIAPDAVQDVYAYVGLKNYIAGLFAGTGKGMTTKKRVSVWSGRLSTTGFPRC